MILVNWNLLNDYKNGCQMLNEKSHEGYRDNPEEINGLNRKILCVSYF
jgi:hypothetical protein